VAEAFASAQSGLDLDFTPASLARLDELATSRAGEASEQAVVGAGAYLGETFVRSYGGEWRDDGGGWAVAFDGSDERPVLSPATVAAECLSGDRSFAAAHDEAVYRHSLDGSLLGSGRPASGSGFAVGADDADERAAGEERSPEEIAAADRAAAADLASEWPAYDLDRSVESLVRLDTLVADHYDHSGGDREYDGDPLSVPEGARLSIPTDGSVEAFGGYLATLLARHHDGRWRTDDGEATFVVEGPAGVVAFDPGMVAIACFAGESSFVDAYAHVAARAGLEPALGG
jgi:hypothetical protein